ELVVQLRKTHPVALALAPRALTGRRGVFRGWTPVSRIDVDRRQRWRPVVDLPRQPLVRSKQEPAVGDRDDRLPLLARALQEQHEVLERFERELLATAGDHLLRDDARPSA